MLLTYKRLKELIPFLNERVVTPEDLYAVFDRLGIHYFERKMRKNGYYVRADGEDYVFIKRGLETILAHETLAHEGGHALTQIPEKDLESRNQLQAEAFALICLMPVGTFRNLSRTADALEGEEYELLKRRNEVWNRWRI